MTASTPNLNDLRIRLRASHFSERGAQKPIVTETGQLSARNAQKVESPIKGTSVDAPLYFVTSPKGSRLVYRTSFQRFTCCTETRHFGSGDESLYLFAGCDSTGSTLFNNKSTKAYQCNVIPFFQRFGNRNSNRASSARQPQPAEISAPAAIFRSVEIYSSSLLFIIYITHLNPSKYDRAAVISGLPRPYNTCR